MIRRGGIASVLKYGGLYFCPLCLVNAIGLDRNCAFNTPAHRALLSPDTTSVNIPPSTIEASGIDVLPYLLLPLAGPEEYELEVRQVYTLFHSTLIRKAGPRAPPPFAPVPPVHKAEGIGSNTAPDAHRDAHTLVHNSVGPGHSPREWCL